jgi:hypothetical protein
MNKSYVLIFILGFFSCALIGFLISQAFSITGFAVESDIRSPGNWIDKDDIIIFEEGVILNISNASLSSYAETGSMKPFLDHNSNGIRIKPRAGDEIGVGDIISYRFFDGLLIHRVIEKGVDEKGIYFIAKGDDNLIRDHKIRFEEIEWVTIAIIY